MSKDLEIQTKWQSIKEEIAELGKTALKIGLAVTPALLSPEHAVLMTYTGAYTSELCGYLFNKREQVRISSMQYDFTARIAHLEFQVFQERFEEPKFQDFYEEAVYAAAKTKQQERLKIIAKMLANAVKDGSNIAEQRYWLSIISSLNDLDLMILIELKNAIYMTEEDGVRILPKNISERKALATGMAWTGLDWSGKRGDLPVSTEIAVRQSISRLANYKIVAGGSINSTEQRQGTYKLDEMGEILLQFIDSE